jgi:hypothetical protein
MRWAGHVACTESGEERKDDIKDLGVNWRIALE